MQSALQQLAAQCKALLWRALSSTRGLAPLQTSTSTHCACLQAQAQAQAQAPARQQHSGRYDEKQACRTALTHSPPTRSFEQAGARAL